MADRDNILIVLDHVSRGLDLMLGQFHESSDLKAFVTPLLQEVQEIEDVFFDLFVSRTLELATGDALDQYGKITGEPRNGLSDRDYRRFLKVRILSNFCQGDITRVQKIIKTMAGSEKIQYDALYPAGYLLTYNVPDELDQDIRDRISKRAELTAPSGVGVDVIEAYGNESFGFAESDGLGFGEGIFSTAVRIDDP